MLENLFKDFVRRVSSRGALTGNVDATERLLANFLPGDKVSVIMEEIRGPAGRNMWEKLSNVQENVLANYLIIELKDVPRSTKYYWFNKAGISYQSNQMYGNKDLALVAFIACKWAINKRPVVMKSANPEAYKLTIGRSNNNG